MQDKVQLKNIKSYLSGKNPIKETPKGFRYKFFNKKKKFKDKIFKSGDICFFSDYGDKACYNSFKYRLNCGKFEKIQNRETIIWFRIKNNRLVINKGVGPQNRTISNDPNYLIHSCYSKVIDRLKPFLISWLRKNNFKIKRKWLKYEFKQFILVLCYPEIEYLFDVGLKFDKIPGFLAKDLKGVKGYNHILDRVFGFHGKKTERKNKNIQSNKFF
jgi:hypothetical protein